MAGEKTVREIMKQPELFRQVAGQFDGFTKTIEKVFKEDFDQVIFIGCGTSFYLASTLASHFSKFTDKNSMFVASWEFYLNTDTYVKKNKKYLLVPITRVSTTTETFEAVKKGRTYSNVKSLAITCDEHSYTYNDYVLYIQNIVEESIVMTSSYSTMLLTGMLLSFVAGKKTEQIAKLKTLGDKLDSFVAKADKDIKNFAANSTQMKLFVGLGTGCAYGLAGEASIKIKEMCLVPTEVFSTLEYRHGPISIADEHAVYAVFVEENCKQYSLSLIKELKNLKSKVIALGCLTDEIKKEADLSFDNLLSEDLFLPALIIPLQLLGVYASLQKGFNPDVPRNLTKAVILK